MITCHNVFNVWPKTTLLPLWPGDAKRLDTTGHRGCCLTHIYQIKPSEDKSSMTAETHTHTHTHTFSLPPFLSPLPEFMMSVMIFWGVYFSLKEHGTYLSQDNKLPSAHYCISNNLLKTKCKDHITVINLSFAMSENFQTSHFPQLVLCLGENPNHSINFALF